MSAYSIDYDLKKPGRNHSGLYDAVKQSGKWWHYLDSTWIVITQEQPQQIWNRLAKQIDKNDYMLIISRSTSLILSPQTAVDIAKDGRS